MRKAGYFLKEATSRRCCGQTRWGWRTNSAGIVEPDAKEQAVVVCVRHMRACGSPLRDIVNALRDIGIVGRRGKPLGTTRVFELIHGGKRVSPSRRAIDR